MTTFCKYRQYEKCNLFSVLTSKERLEKYIRLKREINNFFFHFTFLSSHTKQRGLINLLGLFAANKFFFITLACYTGMEKNNCKFTFYIYCWENEALQVKIHSISAVLKNKEYFNVHQSFFRALYTCSIGADEKYLPFFP